MNSVVKILFSKNLCSKQEDIYRRNQNIYSDNCQKFICPKSTLPDVLDQWFWHLNIMRNKEKKHSFILIISIWDACWLKINFC